jgi:hypothetical protein
MTFDPTWLFLSMIPSGIGFVLLVYGKKQQRWPHMIAGLLFSIYPYVTDSVVALLGTGAAIAFLLWCAIRLDW